MLHVTDDIDRRHLPVDVKTKFLKFPSECQEFFPLVPNLLRRLGCHACLGRMLEHASCC
jgi:hypothetical protein